MNKIFRYFNNKWKQVFHTVKREHARAGIRQLTAKQIDKLMRSNTTL